MLNGNLGCVKWHVGNVLSDYVQSGGRLILATNYWQKSGSGVNQWGALEDIDPFEREALAAGIEYGLDEMVIDSTLGHPVTEGIDDGTVKSYDHGGVVLKDEGTAIAIAKWASNDHPAIGVRTNQCIVSVTASPIHENRCYQGCPGNVDTVDYVGINFYKLWRNVFLFATTGFEPNWP